MDSAILIQEKRPYLGLNSFKEEDQDNFFGREQEIADLLEQIDNYVLTVIYGKSGIGKTSLLKAGLIPALKKEYCLPIYIRINFEDEKHTPLQQVKEITQKHIAIVDGTHTFAGDTCLWEYFHHPKIVRGFITPVLIFDQFEEIFTIGKNDTSGKEILLQELSELIENKIPVPVSEKYRTEKKYIPNELSSEKKYKIIFSLREDYLPQLDCLKQSIPSIQLSQFRVLQMQGLQALDAIMKPAEGLIEFREAVAVIKKIPPSAIIEYSPHHVTDNSWENKKIEPFLLSLYCYQLNEERIANKADKITLDLIGHLDVANLVKKHYENTIVIFKSEEKIKQINRAVEDLLTNDGYRKLYPLNELQKLHALTDDDMDVLVDNKIVRREKRDAILYVELIHDALIGVVKEKHDERIVAEQMLAERQQQDMLRSQQQKAYEEERAKQRARTIRWIAIISSTLTCVALLFLWFAISQREKAQNLAIEANELRQIAEKKAAEANEQRIKADQQASLAQLESEKAIDSEQKAREQQKIALEEKERAEKNEQIARRERLRAEQQRQAAIYQSRLAEEARKNAEEERQKALAARDSMLLTLQANSILQTNLDSVKEGSKNLAISNTLEKSRFLRTKDPRLSYFFARKAYSETNENAEAETELLKAYHIQPFFGTFINFDKTATQKLIAENAGYNIEALAGGNVKITSITQRRDSFYAEPISLSAATEGWNIQTGRNNLLLIHDQENKAVNIWALNQLKTNKEPLYTGRLTDQVKFSAAQTHLISLKKRRIEVMKLPQTTSTANVSAAFEPKATVGDETNFMYGVDFLSQYGGKANLLLIGDQLYSLNATGEIINQIELPVRSGRTKPTQQKGGEMFREQIKYAGFTADLKNILIVVTNMAEQTTVVKIFNLSGKELTSKQYQEAFASSPLNMRGYVVLNMPSQLLAIHNLNILTVDLLPKKKGATIKPGAIVPMDVSVDGKLLAFSSSTRNIGSYSSILIFDLPSGEQLQDIPFPHVEQLKFSPDNQYIFASAFDQLQIIYYRKPSQTLSGAPAVIEQVEQNKVFGNLWDLTEAERKNYGL